MTTDDLSVEELVTEHSLPDEQWDELWSRIYVDEESKQKLVNYGLLLRQFQAEQLDRMTLSHHGVILLTGPPGTGKTSLAKGAANELAKKIDEDVQFKQIEVQHLFSGSLGDTPKLVENAFRQVIEPARNPEYDAYQVLLLDEVESLFSSRSMLSGDTDPMDAVRAVNTALEAIDELSQLPGVYLIATSNQPKAVDRAYYDRTDDQIFLGNPATRHRQSILQDVFTELNETLGSQLPTDPEAMAEAVEKTEGFSGRRIRKTVLAALSRNETTVRNPSELTYDQVLAEIERTYDLIREKGSSDYINLGETPDEALPDAETPQGQPRETPAPQRDSQAERTDPRTDPESAEESDGGPNTSDHTPAPTSDTGESERAASQPEADAEATQSEGATVERRHESDDTVPERDATGQGTGPAETDRSETESATEDDDAPSSEPEVQADSTGGAQSDSTGGAQAGSQDEPTDWLDSRTAVFDTAAMNSAEALRDDLLSYFTDTLDRAGAEQSDGLAEVLESDEISGRLEVLCMRRLLSAVSVTVGDFTTTVDVETDRSVTPTLAVPSEESLPTLDGDDELSITFHVDGEVDAEQLETNRDDITLRIQTT